MLKIDKSKILQRIVGNDHLPSASPLLVKLVAMAAEDTTSVSDLAQVIKQDPGLATRLLKLVNSAFYARREKISSLQQAIVLIGFNKLRTMALTLSLKDTFPLGKVGGMDYDYFWKTSLYRALIAQGLARSSPLLRGIHPEEAFTAGLILEIGMLMLYQVCPEALKDSFPGGNVPLEEAIRWEEDHLGINHRDIGYITLTRWQFPKQIIESQKYFGTNALTEERSALCKILELARSSTLMFFDKKDDFAFIDQIALVLGLDADKINKILCETFSSVQDIADQLQLKVNSDQDILEIMEKANQALAKINGSLEGDLGKVLDLISYYEQSENGLTSEIIKGRKKVLEDLLDAVAHEIRNPLMVIGGFARRISENLVENAKLLDYANIIAQESSRLEKILKEICALSQAYKPSFIIKSNIVELLDSIIDDLHGLLKQKNISVLRDYKADSLFLCLDQEAVSEAFRQILETVIQLIEKNDGEIRISLRPHQTTGEVKIDISSNVVSIPESIRQIFLGGPDFSSKAFGFGLRLVVAQKILEAHQGHIELEEKDETSRFIICLPIASR